MIKRLGSALLLAAPCLQAGTIKPDEQVMFIPQVALEQPDGRVLVNIRAWVYEHEPRAFLHWLFARYLRIDERAMSEDERALFRQRTQLFRVDSERRKQVEIALPDGQRLRMPRTGADGRSDASISIQPQDEDSRIRFSVLLPPGDERHIEGHAVRVPAQGWSVVSDIDDTIKHSQVTERRALLLNTFARPFQAVPGMAARYRQFAEQRADTRFHYVSTSPMQLYPALADFLRQSGFPEGSMHLRDSTRWRDLPGGDAATHAHKREAIESLLSTFPQRRFILIGDAGEHDPAIYADLARRHPGRITHIAIRRLDADNTAHTTPPDDIGHTQWQWFDAAEELRLPQE